MRFSRRGLGAVALVSALVTAPIVAPASGGATAAQQPKILRVGVTQLIDSLNPFISITRTGTDLLRTQFDYLTVYSQKEMTPEASLAESWETSADKLTWTFHLRDGVKWSDGTPLTAKDPAFTYNLMLKNETARTANGNFVDGWESVEAKDDRTLVIKTKEPRVTMLALDVPIVPEHVWSKVTDVGAPPAMPMVGSGPYTLYEFKEAQFAKMKANKSYWRGAPKIDELHFVYFKNADAAVQALRNGEVDLVNRLNPNQFETLKSDPNVTLNNAKNRRFNEIVLNPGAAANDGTPIGDGHPALKDSTVRRAIAQAIDTSKLVDKVWAGYAIEAAGYIPPVFSEYHWKPSDDKKRKFDPAAANKALDEAGYARGPDGVRGKDGKTLNFRLLAHSGATLDETAGPFIVGWLKDIGINVSLQPVSDDKINEDTTRGNFDLAFSGWNTNPDPDYVLSLQTCKNRPNAQGKGATPDSFLCDEEYDKLYNEQLQELDQSKRSDIVKRMQERLYDQATLVILGYDNALEAFRKDKWEGFPPQPADGGVFMNQQGYWGYYGATPSGMGPVPGFGASGNSASAGTAADDSDNTGLILGIGGAVLVAAAAAGLVVVRRRRLTAGDRE